MSLTRTLVTSLEIVVEVIPSSNPRYAAQIRLGCSAQDRTRDVSPIECSILRLIEAGERSIEPATGDSISYGWSLDCALEVVNLTTPNAVRVALRRAPRLLTRDVNVVGTRSIE
jgi:hypothetical protein